MNYEKKYNYVLKCAKELKKYCLSHQVKDLVDKIFPELAESENDVACIDRLNSIKQRMEEQK
jgi:hypothetical protein